MNKELKLVMNEYIGVFYVKTPKGWRKWHTIGNAGIAQEVGQLFQRLGHKVEFVEVVGNGS